MTWQAHATPTIGTAAAREDVSYARPSPASARQRPRTAIPASPPRRRNCRFVLDSARTDLALGQLRSEFGLEHFFARLLIAFQRVAAISAFASAADLVVAVWSTQFVARTA